jgi:hypothetical protein
MAQAVRFVDGPLDAQVFFIQGAPSVLYVRRTVSTEGVVFAPASHEGPELLRAGRYRKTAVPNSAGRFVYRFEG